MRRLFQNSHRVLRGVGSRVRNLYYRLLGVRLGGYVWMRRVSIPQCWEDITLESGVALDDGVVLLCSGVRRAEKLVVREGAYLNRHTMIDAHRRIEIGRNVMIGPFCYVTDADHGFDHGGSVKAQAMETAPVVIEEDAWLGAGVTVLKGVRIGQGAVIGAGSVVTRDIPAGQIAVGVPCRVIGTKSTAPVEQT